MSLPSTDGPGMTGAAGPSSSARLLRSSSIMAAGTISSRALGFVRNAVIAAAIGTGLVGDTYALANAIPNVLFTLVAGGLLNAVFVPQLVRAMTSGEEEGKAYADRLLTLSLVVLAAITVAATFAAPFVVRIYAGGDFEADDLALATAFAYWCLPQIFFYGLFTMLGQVANARGSFGPMMWTPILNNVVVIATGIAFISTVTLDTRDTDSVSRNAVAVLGAGTTLGIVVQAVALIPVLRRTGYRFHPRFDWRGVGLGRAGTLAKWTLAYVVVTQLAYWVVVKLTTNAGKVAGGDNPGSGYTPYQNAYLIFLLPHAIVTVSMVTALLPRMSAAAVREDFDAVREDVSQGLRLSAVATIPAAALFLIAGPEIGAVLFSFGAANVEDGLYLGRVLAAFSLGIVPFSAHYLMQRGFYALEDTRTPFFFACAVAAVNSATAYIASEVAPADSKTVWIAGAYTVSSTLGLALSSTVLRRRLGGQGGPRVVRTFVRLGLAAVIGAVPGWLVIRLVRSTLPADAWSTIVLALGLGVVVTAGCYLVAARRMHVSEVGSILSTMRGRISG